MNNCLEEFGKVRLKDYVIKQHHWNHANTEEMEQFAFFPGEEITPLTMNLKLQYFLTVFPRMRGGRT